MKKLVVVLLAACIVSTGAWGSYNPLQSDDSELLSCPAATNCPTGYTGGTCDLIMCATRGKPYVYNASGEVLIDINQLAYCSGSFQVPVDSHVRSITISIYANSTSGTPTLQLLDPTGYDVTSQLDITASQQTLTATLPNIHRKSAYGVYTANINAGGGCTFSAFAVTNMMFQAGFTYGDNYMFSDNIQPSLPENTPGALVGFLTSLFIPGFPYEVKVYKYGQLQAIYPIVDRLNCEFHIAVGPVTCNSIGDLWYEITGIDELGFQFKRTDQLPCSTPTTTTSPMPTTTAPCLNSGVYNQMTNQCDCGFYFTGTVCQQPVCFNGGTPVQNACICPTGYADLNCLEASCMPPNTNLPPFSPYGRTLTLMIQNTNSMMTTIGVIQDYASEIYYNFQLQYPGYILNYVVVTFNPDTATLLCNTNDANTFFQALYNIALSNSTSCQQQFNQALSLALNPQTGPQPASYSDTYIFTNSPPDTTNSIANLGTQNLIETKKNSLFFNIEVPSVGFCSPWTGSDFMLYRTWAQISGGLAMLLQGGVNSIYNLQMIPASYQRQQMYQKKFTDCTYSTGLNVYVPVDSHTGSLEIAIQGNLPGLDVFAPQPDGTEKRLSIISLVDNIYTAVRQVITPCPDGWVQMDNKCFSREFQSATWYDANAFCIANGGSLVSILNQERQQFIDSQTGQINIWIGLSKVNSGGSYVWQVGNSTIPLGRYTNWGNGQPTTSSGNDCVSNQYNNSPSGTWSNLNCNTKLNYVCEKPALMHESPSFPPGLYRINFNTVNNISSGTVPNAYGTDCLLTINGQSDMQLFYGYNTGNDSLTNDMPSVEPLMNSTTNRFVANFTHLDPTLASVSTVEFLDLNYNLLQAKQMTHRVSPCAYQYVSDVFSCPSGSFATLMTGIDDHGYTFNRYDWGLCTGTASMLEDNL